MSTTKTHRPLAQNGKVYCKVTVHHKAKCIGKSSCWSTQAICGSSSCRATTCATVYISNETASGKARRKSCRVDRADVRVCCYATPRKQAKVRCQATPTHKVIHRQMFSIWRHTRVKCLHVTPVGILRW